MDLSRMAYDLDEYLEPLGAAILDAGCQHQHENLTENLTRFTKVQDIIHLPCMSLMTLVSIFRRGEGGGERPPGGGGYHSY